MVGTGEGMAETEGKPTFYLSIQYLYMLMHDYLISDWGGDGGDF